MEIKEAFETLSKAIEDTYTDNNVQGELETLADFLENDPTGSDFDNAQLIVSELFKVLQYIQVALY